MGNSKSDIRCGGKQVWVCQWWSHLRLCSISTHYGVDFGGVKILNDLIKVCYFSLLQKGSTNSQSQLEFLCFYCWLHVSAFVKTIIRQLKIYKSTTQESDTFFANSSERNFKNWNCFNRKYTKIRKNINPLNAKLNPICHLLALLGAHHIIHVSRVRVNVLKYNECILY